MNATANRCFEITAQGFDGDTDETDDRVLWVAAQSASQVKAVISGLGAIFTGELPSSPEQCAGEGSLDYDLTEPAQHQSLRERLMYFQITPPTTTQDD